MKNFLNWLAVHPTYSDSTKEVYGTLICSRKFQEFYELSLVDTNAALQLITSKSESAQTQYIRLAKKICIFNGKPEPVMGVQKHVVPRITSNVPLLPEPVSQITWEDMYAFSQRFTGNDVGQVLQWALLTGARVGELLSITRQCDAGHVLHISSSRSPHGATFSTTKAGYSRIVPISDELRCLLARRPNEHFLVPQLPELLAGHQSTWLRRICRDNAFPEVKFHEMRGMWATKMLQDGLPIVEVMRRGGWKNYATVERYLRLR